MALRDELSQLGRGDGVLLYGARNTSWRRSDRGRPERCAVQSVWVAVSGKTVHVRGERNFYTPTLGLLADNSTAPASFFGVVERAYRVRRRRKRKQLEPRPGRVPFAWA